MRKVILLFLGVLLTCSVFAQEPGATEKNAANAAMRPKTIQKHLSNWKLI